MAGKSCSRTASMGNDLGSNSPRSIAGRAQFAEPTGTLQGDRSGAARRHCGPAHAGYELPKHRVPFRELFNGVSLDDSDTVPSLVEGGLGDLLDINISSDPAPMFLFLPPRPECWA